MAGLANGALQWTVSVWCWSTDPYNAGVRSILSWGDSSTNINTMLTDNSSGLGGNIIEVRGHAQDRPPAYGLSQNTWMNVVFTNNATATNQKYSYLNGVAQSTYPGGASNPSTAATAQGTPGKFAAFYALAGNQPIIGRIGLIKFWNVALTSGEIATEYNTYKSRYGLA